MGIMICEQHGRSHFVETCSHAATQIGAGQAPTGHHLTILGHLFVCDDCFASLHLQKFMEWSDLAHDEIPDMPDELWKEYESAYEAVEGRRAFCLKCFAEFGRPITPG
jgi:hypothetical protein